MNPSHLACRQLEPMSQKTREKVQFLLTRWGESVHPVSYLQELQQGRVLGTLGVRVVELQNQVPDGLGVKVHAVAKHLDGVDLHIAQVTSRFRHFQRLVVHAIVQSLLSLYPAPKVDVDGLKKSLPLVAQRQSPVVALEGQVQLGGLPVGETVLVGWDVPAL